MGRIQVPGFQSPVQPGRLFTPQMPGAGATPPPRRAWPGKPSSKASRSAVA